MLKSNPVLNTLHDSFAILLCSIIISDNVVSEKEKKKFHSFFKNEFSLSIKEIEVLFFNSMNSLDMLDNHIIKLKKGLEGYALEKAHFMQYLNECIICDGVDSREYVTFENIRLKLF